MNEKITVEDIKLAAIKIEAATDPRVHVEIGEFDNEPHRIYIDDNRDIDFCIDLDDFTVTYVTIKRKRSRCQSLDEAVKLMIGCLNS